MILVTLYNNLIIFTLLLIIPTQTTKFVTPASGGSVENIYKSHILFILFYYLVIIYFIFYLIYIYINKNK